MYSQIPSKRTRWRKQNYRIQCWYIFNKGRGGGGGGGGSRVGVGGVVGWGGGGGGGGGSGGGWRGGTSMSWIYVL